VEGALDTIAGLVLEEIEEAEEPVEGASVEIAELALEETEFSTLVSSSTFLLFFA